MPRVASLYLPHWPIERLRRAERTARPPETAPADLAPLRAAAAQEQENACSVPRGGGWRPGARWAREDALGHVARLPDIRQPAKHEVGRRDEAAGNPFKAGPRDDGGRTSPSLLRHPGPTGMLDGAQAAPPAKRPKRERARPGGPRNKSGVTEPSGVVQAAPLITALRTGNRQTIAAADPAARALGLAPGMAVAQARALVPGLDIRPADPAGDLADLERLAVMLARRWCPVVTRDGADGLLLDLTGTAHLFGGEGAMARRLIRLLARAGITARIAVADTAGAAHALARHTPGGLCPPGRQGEAVAALPLAGLRIDDTAIELLHRLGVQTIGALAAMPRAPLARRFGNGLVTQLERALGTLPEPLDPIVPAQPIAVCQRFAEPIGTAEAIAHWLGALVPQLAGALAQAGLGARRLLLVADRVDGVPQRIAIGLARPNRDPAHLLRLLARRIETIEPGYGIDALTLHLLRAEPLAPAPVDERVDEEAAPDIATLVDTLATRIGPDAMWRNRPVESDVPERSVARAPLLDPPTRTPPRPREDAVEQLDRSAALHPWHPAWPKPARLLRRPELLDHVVAELPDHAPRRFTWRGTRHLVVRSDGPERVHGEWWKRATEMHHVRDYFRVEDEQGRRYWLFRRGDGERPVTGDLSWYLHGVFG
jgi:protein ImuB